MQSYNKSIELILLPLKGNLLVMPIFEFIINYFLQIFKCSIYIFRQEEQMSGCVCVCVCVCMYVSDSCVNFQIYIFYQYLKNESIINDFSQKN